MKKAILITAAILAFTISFVATLGSAPADRFDHKVRSKFFAGFAGDAAAFQEGMKECEEILKENPKHAEAMVWYGGGLFTQSGQAFRSGDQQKAMQLFERGVKMMEEAVALAPDHIGVRVPRGAIFVTATRFMPEEFGRPLLAKALEDYEHVLKLQEPYFEKLGVHPRGELLFGLAEGWSRAGDMEKATRYFERVVKELDGTAYQKRASKWLATKSLPVGETGCIGCHVSK